MKRLVIFGIFLICSLMLGTTNIMLPQVVNAQEYISNPNLYGHDYELYIGEIA